MQLITDLLHVDSLNGEHICGEYKYTLYNLELLQQHSSFSPTRRA